MMCQIVSQSISRSPKNYVSPVSPKGNIPFSPRFSLSSSSADSVANELLKGLILFPDITEETKKVSKSVRFDATIHVVLIPSREEYIQEKLASRVWYNKKELARIEKEGLVSASLGRYYDKLLQGEDEEEYGDTSRIYPLLGIGCTDGMSPLFD